MWWSIEVIDGASSAAAWQAAHGDAVVEAALAQLADDWSWHQHRWGVIFEVSLPDDAAWDRFFASPTVQAALDATPDPVGGLIVYRGRGGSAGQAASPRPRPLAGAGAVALPLPDLPPELVDEVLPEPVWLSTFA